MVSVFIRSVRIDFYIIQSNSQVVIDVSIDAQQQMLSDQCFFFPGRVEGKVPGFRNRVSV
ncbi:MAG: hypothetical protein JJU13_18170 [Balneolaceae bacterium]|nr:hypothetical protein [Balneolaceae bacterium]